MPSMLDRYDFVSRLFFVFHSIGSILLKVPFLTTVVKRFVINKEKESVAGKELPSTESFFAECKGLIY